MLQASLKDRRKAIRYRPKNGTMAVSSHALGPVINISMGGLAFRYLEDDTNRPSSEPLGIFLGSDDILIDQIATKVISDRLISEGSVFLKTSTRQRSIQFLNLTKEQHISLESFITQKTQGAY